MRAASFSQFGGPEVLEIVDLPEPHAGPGQIRIAVHAAGINATDWKVRQGQMGGDLPQSVPRRTIRTMHFGWWGARGSNPEPMG